MLLGILIGFGMCCLLMAPVGIEVRRRLADSYTPKPIKGLSDSAVAHKMHVLFMYFDYPGQRTSRDRMRLREDVSTDDLKALYCTDKITLRELERYAEGLAVETLRR